MEYEYHVMLRGNNREKVFRDEEDKARIIDTPGEKRKKKDMVWCYGQLYSLDNKRRH